MLELKDINLNFKSFSLQNVSLKVKEQEYHILLGPSGSGKTLLMNIIAGFQSIDSGMILYKGVDITRLGPQKRNIAYLFQDLALFPHLTVFENVAFSMKMKRIARKEITDQVDKYLDFTGAVPLANRQIGTLSGGEKQKVALARILITGAKMLLLDEPFSAVDTPFRLELKKLLKKIQGLGVSVLHITHNFEEAVALGDQVTLIEKGKIISSDELDDFGLSGSKFAASLIGERNYFYVKQVISEPKSSTLMISPHPSGKTTLPVIFTGQLPGNPTALLIRSEHILLSPEKLVSSALNNFEAVVSTVFRNEHGFDLELSVVSEGVNTGEFNFWVRISEQSFNEMHISIRQKLWLSFKASSVRVF